MRIMVIDRGLECKWAADATSQQEVGGYQSTTWHHDPEDLDFSLHHCGNFISSIIQFTY
jgi:hypothetical protein